MKPFTIEKLNGSWQVYDLVASTTRYFQHWAQAMTYVNTRIQLHHLTH